LGVTLYVTGGTSGDLFGKASYSGKSNMIVVRLNRDGDLQRATQLPSYANEYGTAITYSNGVRELLVVS
jgi:hypothetical protein